ncbi:MAG: class I SAM-dependent methyltransferase [Rhodospirillaceae bacterium]
MPTLALPPLQTWVLAAALAMGVAGTASAQSLDVPFVPTPQEVVDRMLEMAEVGPDDYLIDLGSGDGRIPITAARLHKTRGMGVDLNPVRVAEAQAGAREAGVEDTVEFRVQDLFDTDISQATVLTMYLLPQVNLRLRPRILEELEPGTRVVSHAFDMDDWQPDAQDKVGTRQVFLWVVPAQVAGQWQIDSQEGPLTISLSQTYQRIAGEAMTEGGRTLPLQNASLRGDEIRFTVAPEDGEPRTFAGRVNGDTIESLDESDEWQARRPATAEAPQ